MQQSKLNGKEITLLISSAFFAVYNLYGWYLVASTQDNKSVNGWPNLLFIIVLIANIVWVFKNKRKIAFIGLMLCAITIVAMFLTIRASLSNFH